MLEEEDCFEEGYLIDYFLMSFGYYLREDWMLGLEGFIYG